MPDPNPNIINFFAKTNFRNRQVPFGIKVDDRRRHMYVIGKTGMGKTTMMENMVIQDIRNGNGVCFIDPHGDSIAKILDYIPNDRVNDVVYFNPADLDNPIAFNILEAVDSKYRHLVASGLMGVFTKIWANMWSARMEYILGNTILALLESPGNTMLGIVRMYVDKKYRKRIVDNVKDPMVKAFWTEEFANYAEKYRTEAVAPIQNKVGQFLSSAVIRNIVGQPKSTIDLREIMDNRKILLLDLSKGKVGEDNSALLGAMIITKLQLAALSRVDVPETERKDFYLFVDEFQNFVTDSFATILSEARKYRLNLTMGHQYIGQLTPENNTKVRDAVFGNVGSMVVFRVGAADAEYLETEFEPAFTPTDIVNLPKYNVILKLMINGVSSDPFSASTIPVNDEWYTGNSEKVMKVSRERYANNKDEVEEKIMRWMGSDFHEASATSISGEGESAPALPAEIPEVRVELKPVEQPREIEAKPVEATAPEPSKPGIKISSEFVERMQRPPSEPRPEYVPQKQTEPRQQTQRAEEPRQQPRSEHRQKFPGDRRNNDQDHSSRSGGKKFGKNRSSVERRLQNKKQNPIWDTASSMNQEKEQNLVHNVASAVEKVFDKPAVPIPPPAQTPPPDQSSNVLKPGETQTL